MVYYVWSFDTDRIGINHRVRDSHVESMYEQLVLAAASLEYPKKKEKGVISKEIAGMKR